MNLRKAARGQDCTLRILGVCNYEPETTVLCHVRKLGGGMTESAQRSAGQKPPDSHGVWACSACHDTLDGRTPATDDFRDDFWFYVARGLARTHERYDALAKRP